jgi:arylsulfatase A-like enzyme
MKRKSLSCSLIIAAIFFLGNACQQVIACVESPKTNVVFILADDLGWRDLSNEGSTFYESPNIDKIANSGVKFTRGYATCQVCSPSRASIMTGKYPARLAITDWIGAAMGEKWKRNTKLLPATYNLKLPTDDTTIAEAFQQAGYKTFFAGKWHLGGEGSLPEDHGFDINVGGHHRGSPPGGFFSPYGNPKMKDGPKGELLPIRLGQETADFIEANKDEPFFAFLSFYSVHAPIQTTKALWNKYQNKAINQPQPDSRFLIDRTTPVRQVQDNPLYAGMVESMDDAVGIVMDRLEKLDLMKNTVIVFTSDNGGVSAGDGKATSNLPLRGGKGRQWEGGIREPYYIKWAQGQTGVTCDTLAIGTDFYPTLLEICNLPAKPDQHIDGKSLVPLLKGDKESDAAQSLAKRQLFWHYPHYGNQGGEPSSIVRDGDWKLIHYLEDDRVELYNVREDVGEQKDVAADNVQRVDAMKLRLDSFLEEVGARMPIPNPNYSDEDFRKQNDRIRNRLLPSLESSHEAFLDDDFKPKNGWWGSKSGD